MMWLTRFLILVLMASKNFRNMKYSPVDGKSSEARPRLSGYCPACGEHCGKVVVQKRMCDLWWENETN
jgi:hypothetical protein